MRLVLFFDLPVATAKQRKDYRIFRKFLLKDGFLPLQESVYAKLVVNDAAAGSAIARVRKNRPPEGLVQILRVTESQFATMDYITGDRPAYEEVDTFDPVKLVLSGLENSVEISPGIVTTLQVENGALFARVAQSLVSLEGRMAQEPFTLWEGDVEVKPSSALLVVPNVFDLPWDDCALMGAVLKRIEREFLEDEDLRRAIEAMDSSLSEKLLGLGFGMNSDYGFGLEWDLKRYLKFRGFGVGRRVDESLLDNLLNFISLALDAGCKKAIVFVHVKTFLTNNEVKALFDHVFYSKMKVLLLENKRDGNAYDYERKMIVDLHFLEH